LPSLRRWSGMERKISSSDAGTGQPPIPPKRLRFGWVATDRVTHFRRWESPTARQAMRTDRPCNPLAVSLSVSKRSIRRLLSVGWISSFPSPTTVTQAKFTNDDCESKKCGGFLTPKRTANFARRRRIISSGRKYGPNILKALNLRPGASLSRSKFDANALVIRCLDHQMWVRPETRRKRRLPLDAIGVISRNIVSK
jgi:hypothetical protein